MTADAAGLPVSSVMAASVPLVIVMGLVTTVAAFWMMRRDQHNGSWRDGLVTIKSTGDALTTRTDEDDTVAAISPGMKNGWP